MGYGRDANLVRQARYFQSPIAANVLTDFYIENDIEGNRIPARIKIKSILVKPTASTIREIQLFGKESRVDDASNADHSLIYQNTWTALTVASALQSEAIDERSYYDRDQDDEKGTIWGTLRIKAAEAASGFIVDIYFTQ